LRSDWRRTQACGRGSVSQGTWLDPARNRCHRVANTNQRANAIQNEEAQSENSHNAATGAVVGAFRGKWIHGYWELGGTIAPRIGLLRGNSPAEFGQIMADSEEGKLTEYWIFFWPVSDDHSVNEPSRK